MRSASPPRSANADGRAPAATPTVTDLALERIARLASALFEVPFAQVVRFSGGDGIAAEPTSYGHLDGHTPDLRLACAALPADAAIVVVEDAAKDARVALPEGARFLAFARAEAADGHAVGALCLLDDTPHRFSAQSNERLADLAVLTADAIMAAARARALVEAEARFLALSETVFDALFILDDGVILDANDGAAHLFGHDAPEALIGCSVLDLVPERLVEEVQARLAESGRYEAAICHTEGHEVPVEVRAETFPHSGRLLRVTAVRPRA